MNGVNGNHRLSSTEEEERILFDHLDRSILQTEEEDMMDRIHRDIQYAEEVQVLNPEQETEGMDAILDEHQRSMRNKITAEEDTDPDGEMILSMHRVRFVRLRKTIPRYKQNKCARASVKQALLKSLVKNEGKRLLRCDMKGFAVSIGSANPDSWQVEAKGFEKAINAFIQVLNRETERKRF